MRQYVGRQYFRLQRSRRGAINGNVIPRAACEAVLATKSAPNRRRFSAASAQPSSSVCSKERFIPTQRFKHIRSTNLNGKERLLKALAERLQFFFSDGKGRSS